MTLISVALNYQSEGRVLQLNRAKFYGNGNCGYILKPTCMCEGQSITRTCVHNISICQDAPTNPQGEVGCQPRLILHGSHQLNAVGWWSKGGLRDGGLCEETELERF